MYEIYKITTPKGYVYYGQHNKTPDLNYFGSGTIIQRSLKKYGKDAHKKEVIFTCDTREEADFLEKKVIKEAIQNNERVLNIESGGQGREHYTHSEETKRRLSEIAKKEWSNPEYRIKNKNSRMKRNFHHSDETRKKMSESRRGRKMPDGFSEKIRKANLGKKLSEESKEKIRKANLGKKQSEETRKKRSESIKAGWDNNTRKPREFIAWNKGLKNVYSEEHKRKLSESKKGRKWYTNGKIDLLSYICPEGFVSGRSNYHRGEDK